MQSKLQLGSQPRGRAAGAGERLRITEDERQRAMELIAEFKLLTPKELEDLNAQLKAEVDPRLLAEIDRTRRLLEANEYLVVAREGEPLSIDDLAKRCGWSEDGWELRLVRALDGAGHFQKDGMVLASEIITGLRSPESPRYLTSASVERMYDLIAASERKENNGGKGELIDSLRLSWQKELAIAADANGDRDSRITEREIQLYLEQNPQAVNKLALQNLGVMLHQIAEHTGEADPFKLVGSSSDLAVVRSSYAGSYNQKRMVATVISQTVTASDLKQRGDIDRTDNFHADQLLPEFLQAKPTDYRKTGYDMGHLAASADAVNLPNVEASFSLLNMSPQLPELNRFSWRYLEASVRDLIVATGARAMVYTGTLFLDDKGQPMSIDDPRVKTIGKGGRKIAVPTHCFKSVVLQLPGGKYSTLSYIIENKKALPTAEKQCMELVRSSRASIADIERLAGVKLFEGFLPEEVARQMKADKTSAVEVEAPEKLKATQFLWRPGAKQQSWSSFTSYEMDAALEIIGQRLAPYRKAGGAAASAAELGKLRAAIVTAGRPVSRADTRRIVTCFDLARLTRADGELALRAVRGALEDTGDRQAASQLSTLLKRIEKYLSALPIAAQGSG
ncbi:MAG: DNA/RNA non-specific endonuclease [Deltaproteobacteria bacterium]|nr:DNA/RNA non-specific endonuclease [Deltaproteobacteria bacterium]